MASIPQPDVAHPPYPPGSLTVKQLAAAAGISPSTVWRLKRAGKIPFWQPGGEDTFVRFPANAIQYLAITTENVENGLAAETTSAIGIAAEESLDEINVPSSEAKSSKRKKLSGPLPKWQR